MTATSDDPTAATDDSQPARSADATPLPRRTRRTTAIAEAAAAAAAGTSASSTALPGGESVTGRARPTVTVTEEPGGTSVEPVSAYADGFAAGTAFALGAAAAPNDGTPAATEAQDTAVGTRPRRPRKRLLVTGTILVVGILASIPFLVPGAKDDQGAASTPIHSTALSGEGDGAYAGTASPSNVSSPSAGSTPKQSPTSSSQDGSPSPEKSGKTNAPKDQGTSKHPASTASLPVKTPGQAVAGEAVVGVAIRSHDSGRCIDAGTSPGTPLQIWDCRGNAQQAWQLKSDGSVRSMGMCMEVAGGSQSDGAAIRLADCNGSGAQRFRLNSAHDLVNIPADSCVDVKDAVEDNGTRLQLWSCNGADNQKWSSG